MLKNADALVGTDSLHYIASVIMDIHWITATYHQIFVLLLDNSFLVPDKEYIGSSITSAE